MVEILLNKSIEVLVTLLLEKIFAWVLKDENCDRLNQFLKMQVFVLYLDLVLRKTPRKSLPFAPAEENSETQE
jgi:hypothetical protein